MNLVFHSLSHSISASARSRCISMPEKPTQGAPARAECPTPAAKSAPSSAHSGQNAQGSQWRTRPIALTSQRRHRLLDRGLRFLTPSLFPPHARTRPAPEAVYSQTQQGLTKFRSKEHDLAVISNQSFQVQNLGLWTASSPTPPTALSPGTFFLMVLVHVNTCTRMITVFLIQTNVSLTSSSHNPGPHRFTSRLWTASVHIALKRDHYLESNVILLQTAYRGTEPMQSQ